MLAIAKTPITSLARYGPGEPFTTYVADSSLICAVWHTLALILLCANADTSSLGGRSCVRGHMAAVPYWYYIKSDATWPTSCEE